MSNKPYIHYVADYLLNPTNPVTVSVIGAGGTGSHVIEILGRLNVTLWKLNHPGLAVALYDDDTITSTNVGRQKFSESDVKRYKADVLISRENRKHGTNWKAVLHKYSKEYNRPANITISCVDKVSARFEIAEILTNPQENIQEPFKPYYWIDFGNSKVTGQMLLATIGTIKQPPSKQFKTVPSLPFVTEEYKDLLLQSLDKDEEPSCSTAEALGKQDLFINSSLANMGLPILWKMFKDGRIYDRGIFMNIETLRSNPIPLN